jgi:holin-like protein
VLNGVLVLLGCQVLGEVGVRTLHLPIPGPVLGMVLLFIWLTVRRPSATAGVFKASDALLKHLQLLFIPAGVGVITLFGEIGHAPLPLIGGLLVSWVVGLVAVGWIAGALLRRGGE